jgi:hypothetical protein
MGRPYQPSLLRLLHGLTALLVIGCWLSGLLVYSRYDGRWGRLPFTPDGNWIDLHGQLGWFLLPVGLAFSATNSMALVALVALVLAVATGKLMQENWLRDGELHHLVYALHLVAWLVIGLAVLVHVAGSLQQGGWPLLASMSNTSVREGDLPGDWPGQIRRYMKRKR